MAVISFMIQAPGAYPRVEHLVAIILFSPSLMVRAIKLGGLSQAYFSGQYLGKARSLIYRALHLGEILDLTGNSFLGQMP